MIAYECVFQSLIYIYFQMTKLKQLKSTSCQYVDIDVDVHISVFMNGGYIHTSIAICINIEPFSACV